MQFAVEVKGLRKTFICNLLTYFLEYFRQFYGFAPASSHVLAKGYAWALGYLVLEILLMKAALRRAKRTGLLLKLSE